jgi:hypothetical protein
MPFQEPEFDSAVGERGLIECGLFVKRSLQEARTISVALDPGQEQTDWGCVATAI